MRFEVIVPQLPAMLSIPETKLMALTVLMMAVTVCVLVWRKK
jgi:hypothetical protein